MAKTIYIEARVHGAVQVKLPSGRIGTMLHVADGDEAAFAACKAAGLTAWYETDGVAAAPVGWTAPPPKGAAPGTPRQPLHQFLGDTWTDAVAPKDPFAGPAPVEPS